MKYIYLSATLLFLLLGSCDVLELTPIDKLSEKTIWEDEALIEAYVNGSYNAIPHGFGQDMLCAATDETYCIHNYGNLWPVQRGEMTQDNVTGFSAKINFWEHAYKHIRNINTFFEKIEAAPVDNNKKNRMTGEMKFLRALLYSNLIWRYGGVPIITKVYGLNEDYTVKRDTYDASVDFILSDLDEAIGLLPARQPADMLGKAGGDACAALKSRVLLYAASKQNNPSNDKSRWQKVVETTETLLDKEYSLYDDYEQTFMVDNDEIIFARYYSQANSSDIHTWNGRNGSKGWGAQNPTHNLVKAYEMKTGEYDPSNPYANRDPRFEASILHNGSMWAGRETETFMGGLDSPQGPISAWDASRSGYYLRKFIPEEIPPSGSSVKPTNPWIFFRYAEILLNYAEAKFELGDEETARQYINKVRARKSVGMPPVTASGEELRKKIQHERRIELVFEGHRFFDVRRWGIAMETENENLLSIYIEKTAEDQFTYEEASLLERHFFEKHYLVPIPRAEIDKSEGNLVQNPGY